MGTFDLLDDNSIEPGAANRLYLPPGRFKLAISALKEKSAQDSFHGIPAFIAELIVEGSSVPELGAGAVVNWVQTIKKRSERRDVASIKLFFAALYGDTTGVRLQQALSQVGHKFSQHVSLACQTNAYAGQRIEVITIAKHFERDDKTQGMYTIHDWKPVGTLEALPW